MNKLKILVTGGLGFIGSHTTIELIAKKHEVVIVDNLVNAKIDVLTILEGITNETIPFYPYDVTNYEKMSEVFQQHQFDGVIHFAGLKAVGESVEKPLEYYQNNLISTMTLTQLCREHAVHKFVFSSSATVYGDQESPLMEHFELKKTTNPYGETKAMCERILSDIGHAHPAFEISLLRYFNPIGAHESGLIGENPNGIPNNLMPYITKVAKGELSKLNVFGDDYDTVDGTGVRDYIHVVDLAKGHVAALEHLTKGVHIYNLGTGKGTSVLELIQTFEVVNHVNVPFEIVARRAGDIATCYSDASKAKEELHFVAEKGIAEMCRDAWRFENNQLN